MADETFRPTLAVLADEVGGTDELALDRPFSFQLLQPSHDARGADDLNPYAPSGAAGGSSTRQGLDIVRLADPDEMVTRAWRASVLGLFLLPPLVTHLLDVSVVPRQPGPRCDQSAGESPLLFRIAPQPARRIHLRCDLLDPLARAAVGSFSLCVPRASEELQKKRR